MKSRVEVYRNLDYRDDTVYSVRTTHDRLVCRYVKGIVIKGAIFAVGPKGNQRVRDEKRKNVHAVVRGNWLTYSDHDANVPMPSSKDMLRETKTMALEDENIGWVWSRITYDPYKYKTFVTVDDEKPIHESPCAFVGHECWALVPPK
jgi:hypothetical protein